MDHLTAERRRDRQLAKSLACLVFLTIAVLTGIFGQARIAEKMNEKERLIEELEGLLIEQRLLEEEIEQIKEQRDGLIRTIQERDELERRLKEWLDKFEARRVTVTAYAPLDPRAVEGLCYSGDPNVTASGEPPIPGQTAAGGRVYAFGETVWVEGYGARRINDRGGAIRGDSLDLCMDTKAAAYQHGRRTLWIIARKT